MKTIPPPSGSDIARPPFNPGAPDETAHSRPARLIPDPEEITEPDDTTARDELPDIDFGAPLRP